MNPFDRAARRESVHATRHAPINTITQASPALFKAKAEAEELRARHGDIDFKATESWKAQVDGINQRHQDAKLRKRQLLRDITILNDKLATGATLQEVLGALEKDAEAPAPNSDSMRLEEQEQLNAREVYESLMKQCRVVGGVTEEEGNLIDQLGLALREAANATAQLGILKIQKDAIEKQKEEAKEKAEKYRVELESLRAANESLATAAREATTHKQNLQDDYDKLEEDVQQKAHYIVEADVKIQQLGEEVAAKQGLTVRRDEEKSEKIASLEQALISKREQAEQILEKQASKFKFKLTRAKESHSRLRYQHDEAQWKASHLEKLLKNHVRGHNVVPGWQSYRASTFSSWEKDFRAEIEELKSYSTPLPHFAAAHKERVTKQEARVRDGE